MARTHIGPIVLTLSHGIYEYLDVLIARATIESLALLDRSYRRIDIAEALATTSTWRVATGD